MEHTVTAANTDAYNASASPGTATKGQPHEFSPVATWVDLLTYMHNGIAKRRFAMPKLGLTTKKPIRK